MSVTSVVLAAGAARRLGRPKQVEQVGGLPLVAHALAAAKAADDCLVLLGCAAELVRPAVARYAPAAAVVVVPDWHRGMGHVLACGVRALPRATQAAVILLADQPFVTAAAVSRLVGTWHETGEPWLCASYQGRRGHPHLFDAGWFPSLGALDGEEGARAITAGHRPHAVAVPGSDQDIDDEAGLVAAGRLSCRQPGDDDEGPVNQAATQSNSRET